MENVHDFWPKSGFSREPCPDKIYSVLATQMIFLAFLAPPQPSHSYDYISQVASEFN